MTTVLTLAVIFAVAAALRVARRRKRPVESGPPSRWRAVVIVIAIMAVQSVVGAPAASAAECGEAPNPERPGTGMVGALDPAEARGEKGSAYKQYGYAGLKWYVYETDCGPMAGVTDANTTLDTWAGNQLFNIGKNITGATNALHYTVMEGGLFTPLYKAIKTGTEKVYNNIYAQLFGLAALLLAILMFRHIWRGDLPSVSKRALFALGAVWLAASSFALLRYFDNIDRAIVQTTTNIQAGFVDESEQRVVRHILPTNLHNEIVYKNWLRGAFGAPDSREAEKHGMDLLDAQAFTWEEMARGDDGNQAVIEKKNAEYKRIAEEMGPAAGYFTGEDGSRTGAGFIATLQALVYSLFQLLAKAAILLAQVLVRLLTLTAPLIGLVALLHHDILRRVAKVAGAVAFNLIVLSVLAGVHALLLNAIFAASGTLSMLTQMAMAALVTILLFVVGRPVRRLWQMVDMTTRTVGGALPSAPGFFSRFRAKQQGPTPQDDFWRTVRDTDVDAPAEAPGALGTASRSGRRLRPEASGPVTASAQRLDVGGRHEANSTAGLGSSSGRPALPAAGNPNPARLGFNPAGGFDDGARPAAVAARQHPDRLASSARSRRGGPAPAHIGIRPYDGGEPVVIPSRMTGAGRDHTAVSAGPSSSSPPATTPHWQTTGGAQSPQPRRADAEVINGKPVYVLYRPSRGLEVRQDFRDTDSVVR